LPTNLQNFTRKDLTEVKTFQKVLWGYFFSETPCSFFRGSLCRNPNCIRKTKPRPTFCGMPEYVLLPKLCEKLLPARNILPKSGNPLLSYCQKQFSTWRPSAILNFEEKMHIWSHDCQRVLNVLFYQLATKSYGETGATEIN